jgi:signal transduction histidine kinase
VRPRVGLRTRATLLGVVVSALLLSAGAVLLASTLENRLTDASDQLSRSRVEDLLELAESGDLPAELRTVNDDGVAQVVGPDGTVLAASPNIGGRPAIADLDATASPRVATFTAPDDAETETYRVWYAAGPSADGTVTVYVGSSLEAVDEASAALRRALWIGVPVAVLALGTLLWLLIGRSLARLDRIRAEVDRISAENLHARVPGGAVDDEVGRLAATMNAMLERLDAAAQRQHDLIADVSHDLQSPLAAQRVALELALTYPDHVDLWSLHTEVLGATADMESLVRDLLVLAAADAGQVAEPALVDLDELVLEEAIRARTTSRVPIDTSGVSAAPAWANPDDVRRIARNLLDNAAAHAATGVRVAVEVDGDGRARLDVVDDGPGVPEEHRARIFERFHRVDTARSRGGSGLGLAIARSLTERSGGDLCLVPGSTGAHFRLVLPGGPVSPPGAAP